MKKIVLLLTAALLLTGCAKQDTQMIKFEKDMNSFCDKIVKIDKDINDIDIVYTNDSELEKAKKELLECLDRLDVEFQKFADIDFPEDFDYLEDMADEAGEYMTEAVETYHTIYGTEDGYSVNMEDYANENYARAYKRVKVITALLRGETPDEEGLTIQ